jgi:two-component sensor histidine kinase
MAKAFKALQAKRVPNGKVTRECRIRNKRTDWTLSVGDNGAGMPADPNAKPGLGTGIVEALSKQLDARVTISDAKPGTRVSIVHQSGF